MGRMGVETTRSRAWMSKNKLGASCGEPRGVWRPWEGGRRWPRRSRAHDRDPGVVYNTLEGKGLKELGVKQRRREGCGGGRVLAWRVLALKSQKSTQTQAQADPGNMASDTGGAGSALGGPAGAQIGPPHQCRPIP